MVDATTSETDGERLIDPDSNRPTAHTVTSIRGIIPALPDRDAGDFEAQIEEATEEATRVLLKCHVNESDQES